MIMMGKPMKAQTESIDPVLNNTDYNIISKFKKIKLRQIQTSVNVRLTTFSFLIIDIYKV